MLHSFSKFVSCIKQASLRNSNYAVLNYTIINLDLTKVLYRNGLISHYNIQTSNFCKGHSLYKPKSFQLIVIYFKYYDSFNAIRDIKQISKSGRRIYITNKDMFNSYSKYSFSIISTSFGFYTINELRQLGIGGELLIELIC